MKINLQRTGLFLLLLLTVTFFILGLYYPILSAKYQVPIVKIAYKYQEIRLFDSVRLFYNEGSYLLAGIIFIFTIVLPIVKYLEIANRLFRWIPLSSKVSKFLHSIDKWSMLDVFLVALLLLNFKMDSNIIVMKLKTGTTFIALSVLLRMGVSELIDRYFLKNKNL